MVILISSLTLTKEGLGTKTWQFTQKETTFSTINCDLSDELIKALCVEFLTFWADSCFSGFTFLELVVKSGSKLDYLSFGGWGTFDRLDPKLLLLHGILSRWKDWIQNILSLCFGHVFVILFAKSFAWLLSRGGNLEKIRDWFLWMSTSWAVAYWTNEVIVGILSDIFSKNPVVSF